MPPQKAAAVFVLVFHVCRGLEAYVMYEDRKGDTHRRTQIGAPSYHHSQRSVPLRISTVKAEVNGDEVRRNEKKRGGRDSRLPRGFRGGQGNVCLHTRVLLSDTLRKPKHLFILVKSQRQSKYVLCACVCDAHDRILSSGRHGIEREDASFYRLLTASVGRRGEKTRALSKFRFDRR